MSGQYSILKVPISREKQVMYYYKQYIPQVDATVTVAEPPPSERTIYVVHFLQPIEENFLLKTFSFAGKIKKTIIGNFKPKVSRRAHKRIIYYALVVFKEASSVEDIMKDGKLVQRKVNANAKKQVGYMANPFLAGEAALMSDPEGSDSEENAEKVAKRL